MKLRQLFARRSFSLSTPVLSGAAVVLGFAFWFVSLSTAAPGPCVVCHKRSQTVTVPCNSIQYVGHKGHGDPDGACSSSTIGDDVGRQITAPNAKALDSSSGFLTRADAN
ncbi:MAG: hypothetical protein M3032_12540 [Verrucomicrobiota bacterium]|nr:hypothetical protein [Verrucomicrobiota bacterium]